MNKDKADAIFTALSESIPDPKCALDYTDAFSLLVGIVLSAQSTDVGVNKTTPALFAQANTPEAMLALGFERLSLLIHATGFYRRKAQLLLSLCQQLIERHDGCVPENREALEALSGVGRKSANVFLNTFHGHPTIGVARHVVRVSRRLGLAHSHTPEHIETELEEIVPERWKTQASNLLVLHGRRVCKALRPQCKVCCVRTLCENKALRE